MALLRLRGKQRDPRIAMRRLHGKQRDPRIASLRGICKRQPPSKYSKKVPRGLSPKQRRQFLQRLYEAQRPKRVRVQNKGPSRKKSRTRVVHQAERIEDPSRPGCPYAGAKTLPTLPVVSPQILMPALANCASESGLDSPPPTLPKASAAKDMRRSAIRFILGFDEQLGQ